MAKDCLYREEEPLIEQALDALPEFEAPPAYLSRLAQLTERRIAEHAAQRSGVRLRDERRAAASSSAGIMETSAPSEHVAPTDAPEHSVGSATGLPLGIAEILSTLVTETGGRRFLLKTAVVSVTVGLSFGTTFGICARVPEDTGTSSSSSEERPHPVWRGR